MTIEYDNAKVPPFDANLTIAEIIAINKESDCFNKAEETVPTEIQYCDYEIQDITHFVVIF